MGFCSGFVVLLCFVVRVHHWIRINGRFYTTRLGRPSKGWMWLIHRVTAWMDLYEHQHYKDIEKILGFGWQLRKTKFPIWIFLQKKLMNVIWDYERKQVIPFEFPLILECNYLEKLLTCEIYQNNHLNEENTVTINLLWKPCTIFSYSASGKLNANKGNKL